MYSHFEYEKISKHIKYHYLSSVTTKDAEKMEN